MHRTLLRIIHYGVLYGKELTHTVDLQPSQSGYFVLAYAPPWVVMEAFLSLQKCSASKTITGAQSAPILSGGTDLLGYRNDEAQQLRFAFRVHTTSGGERQYMLESRVVRTVPALQETFRTKTIQEQWKWKVPVPYRCHTGGWCVPIFR